MNTGKEVSEIVKSLAKSINTPIKKVLEDCELNRNFMYDLENSTDMSVKKITKLAEYFDVTLGYLITGEPPKIHNGNISNSTVAQNHSTIHIQNDLSEKEKELIELFRTLSAKQQTELLFNTYQINDKKSNPNN